MCRIQGVAAASLAQSHLFTPQIWVNWIQGSRQECAIPVLDEILSQSVHHRLFVKTGPHSNHVLYKGVLPCLLC